MRKAIIITTSLTIIMGLVLCNQLPVSGTINVRSEPQGATIYLNDSLTGKVTNSLLEDIPFGNHKITLTLDEYQTWERFIEIDENDPNAEIFAGLTEAIVLLQVNSHPEGAAIWLNDEQTDYTTNHLFADLDEGEYTVRLTMVGYDDYDTTVTLRKGDTTLVEHEFDSTLNHPPQILSVSASPSQVQPGEQSIISCTASDADGDQLSFQWYSVLEDTTYTSQTFAWQAPTTEGDYSFYLTVSDGQDEDYDSSLVVTVSLPGISPVTLLPATDVKTKQATLTWTSAEPSWFEYRLYRADRPDVPAFGQLIVTIGYNQGNTRFDTTYTDYDLEPERVYYYALLVRDSTGNEAWSNEITVTTPAFNLLSSDELGGHPSRLVTSDEYVYCASREASVIFASITNTGLTNVSSIPHPGNNSNAWAYDVFVSGNSLHVAFGKGGWCKYDISNPMQPVLIQQVTEDVLGGEARSVHAVVEDIFVGCNNSNDNTNTLVWLNISETPVVKEIDTLRGQPRDLDFGYDYGWGMHVWVIEGGAGLEVFAWDSSSSSPNALTPASDETFNDAANSIYHAEYYGFIAASSEGLLLLDISNPNYPSTFGSWRDYETGNDSQSPFFLSEIIYLADGEYGLRVVDIHDIFNPNNLKTLDIGNRIMDTWVRNQSGLMQAVLADEIGFLYMIEW